MSSDLASLYIRVDSQGVVTASKDLNKLTDDSHKTEKATDGVTAGFGKLKAAVMAVAASYAALKVAQYIKEVTMLAARYETLGVVMRVVGNNAGYSGAEMEVFARGLERTGISMVQARNNLIRMVQAQISLTDANNLGRIAQNAAVIGNMDSSAAFEHMILGIQRGMPLIMRTIGLNVDFEKSERELEVALGKATGTLNEEEIMIARVNATKKAGVLIDGSYTASMETAGKQVLSLTRHLDNLKVLLGALFTPALAEIIGAITGEITGLNKELEKNKEKFGDWGNVLRIIIMEIRLEVLDLRKGLNALDTAYGALGMLATGPGALVGKIPGLEVLAKPFKYFADVLIAETDAFHKNQMARDALVESIEKLKKAMTPEGKEATRQVEEALETTRMLAVELFKTKEVLSSVTKEQLKIQEDFVKEYNKATMSTEAFEIASLNTRVAEFRKAKVNEIKLEEWMQAELRNIKLRAQNQELALLEELYQATANPRYATAAIAIMEQILDAEEKTNAAILKDDADAFTLRVKRYNDYLKKLKEMIGEKVADERNAAAEIAAIAAPAATAAAAGGATGGFGAPTGQSFQMTWASYVGFLTPGVIAQLERNQRAIEAAPAIAAAAAATAAAAVKAADDAQRAADEAIQRAQAIAKQRVELEIQILEGTGYAVEALGIRRMLELSAMDESLRPLQQRIFYLEDEAEKTKKVQEEVAEANKRAAEAQKASAEAARELASAQDKAVSVWKDSIFKLVDQGRTIKDFINSLGATGVSLSLSAAKGAYSADLAAAQTGDAGAYGRITQSAGAYVDVAGRTAGSSVEMARIISNIKRQLSALEPVVKLDENIELLKLINENTGNTALATNNLWLSGIKANFDLSQVITFIANSEGIPDDLRKLITEQTKDYQVWLKAQLDSSVNEDLKRVLIDGSGKYITTVEALAGNIDNESRKLALTALGTYQTTVNAIIGSYADVESKKLAITAMGGYLATVTAALGTVDIESRKLALTAMGNYSTLVNAALGIVDPDSRRLALVGAGSYATTITAALGAVDPESRKLAIVAAGGYVTTVNASFGIADSESRKLALTAAGAYIATINTALGIVDPESRKLAIIAAGSYLTTVNASIGIVDEASRVLALTTTNTLAVTVTAVLGTADTEAKALGLKATNTLATTITAILGVISPDAKKLALSAANEHITTVIANIGLVDSESKKLALAAQGNYLATVTAAMGLIDADSRKLAITAAGDYIATVTAALGIVDIDSRKLALTSAGDYLTKVNAALGIVDPGSRQLALIAAGSYIATVFATLGATNPAALILATETKNVLTATINAVIGTVSADAKKLALTTVNTITAIINASLGAINPDAKALGLNASNILASTVTASMGFREADAMTLALTTANTLASTVTAALGAGNADALKLATKNSNAFQSIVTAALATDSQTQSLKNLLTGAGMQTTIDGTMSWNPSDPLKSIWEAIRDQTILTAKNTGKMLLFQVETSPSYYVPSAPVYNALGIIQYWKPAYYESAHGFAQFTDGSKTTYARGGVFDSGIVTQPTAFNNSTMGEAGPEAIMPLTRGPQGLGVRSFGGDSSPEQTALLKRIVTAIEMGNFQIAKNTGKSAKIQERWDYDGVPPERVVS